MYFQVTGWKKLYWIYILHQNLFDISKLYQTNNHYLILVICTFRIEPPVYVKLIHFHISIKWWCLYFSFIPIKNVHTKLNPLADFYEVFYSALGNWKVPSKTTNYEFPTSYSLIKIIVVLNKPFIHTLKIWIMSYGIGKYFVIDHVI